MKLTIAGLVTATIVFLIAFESPTSAQPDDTPRRIQSEQKQAKQPARYEVVMTAIADHRWGALRYDVQNGQSWRLSDGVWHRIRENRQTKPRKKSQFKVTMVPTGSGRYGALRLDVHTGQSWELAEDIWRPILDLEE